MVILLAFLTLVAGICAIKAVHAVHLLHAALWLAGVSVAVTLMLYLVGAYPLAVIELSLSVGLITILLVFAISMVGADSPDVPVTRWFNWPLLLAMLFLVIGLTIPLLAYPTNSDEASFSTVFWQHREADIVAQIALILAGVLGVLGLLAEVETRRSAQIQSASRQIPEPAQPAVISEDELELEKV
jgi:NADH:ubiquinone oxidoreductase subunit 6 (subunit J)